MSVPHFGERENRLAELAKRKGYHVYTWLGHDEGKFGLHVLTDHNNQTIIGAGFSATWDDIETFLEGTA